MTNNIKITQKPTLFLDKILNIYKDVLFNMSKPIQKKDIEPYIPRILKRYEYTSPTLPITPKCIIERVYQIREFKKSIAALDKVPRIEQKSPEWHAIRKNLISASDFGNALNRGMMKDKSLQELYKKKCGYEVEEPNDKAKEIMGRGCMLEDIVVMLYEHKRKIKIYDYGLIPYEKDRRFGASPDGVSEYGQCIEIKCPYMRKMDGKIPFYYYCQVQGQMEICGFEETDYIECDFHDYSNSFEFDNDYDEDTNLYSKDIKDKGILIGYKKLEDGDSAFDNNYKYSPIGLNRDEIYKWRDSELLKLKENPNIRQDTIDIRYWKLNNMLIQRLYKDQEFIDAMMKELDFVHNEIQRYKKDSFAYDLEVQKNGRAVKRQAKVATIKLNTPVFSPVYRPYIKEEDQIVLDNGVCGALNDGKEEEQNDKLALGYPHESDMVVSPHRYGTDNKVFKEILKKEKNVEKALIQKKFDKEKEEQNINSIMDDCNNDNAYPFIDMN